MKKISNNAIVVNSDMQQKKSAHYGMLFRGLFCLMLCLSIILMMPVSVLAQERKMELEMPPSLSSQNEFIPVHVEGYIDTGMAQEILDIVNEERLAAGQEPLTMDSNLQKTAELRSAELSVYYSHTRPDGSDWNSAFPAMRFLHIGENIAVGQDSAREVMTTWMNSKGHRENILGSDYHSIGIGCFRANGYWCFTQNFSSNDGDGANGQNIENETLYLTDVNLHPSLLGKIKLQKESKSSGKDQLIVTGINLGWSHLSFELDNNLFSFSSSDPNIATVDETGQLTYISTGKATITATLNSNESLETSVKISSVTKPKKVTQNKPKAAKNHGMKISWKKVSCDGYQIQYSTSRSFKNYKNTTVSGKNTLSKTINGLKKGKTYYVKIRAYRINGKKRLYGSFSSVKSIHIK